MLIAGIQIIKVFVVVAVLKGIMNKFVSLFTEITSRHLV